MKNNIEKNTPNYIYGEDLSKISPYVKWVGGKRQLINEIIKYIPKNYDRYIEPFFGGGALFFYLQPDKAIINDINSDLYNSLNIIKNDYLNLIRTLDLFSENHNKDYYYSIRKNNLNSNGCELAARFIYLNKTCFNGMYRVNSKNEFNVPFNGNLSPTLYSNNNIRMISNLLNNKNIKIFNLDFSEILQKSKPNDFLFLDPPYDTETNQFTSYTKNKFDRCKQEELANLLDALNDNNVKWMLTNSPTNFICERYKKYNQKIFYVNRFINANAKKRIKTAKEIIITNYEE